MSLGLTAKKGPQQMVLDYLERTASETLREKIKNGNKTMDGCWEFIMKEAKKQAKGNSACIEDQVVYGWAVHYFEEEGIQESTRGRHGNPKKQEKKKDEPSLNQMTIFDFWSENNG